MMAQNLVFCQSKKGAPMWISHFLNKYAQKVCQNKENSIMAISVDKLSYLCYINKEGGQELFGPCPPNVGLVMLVGL